MSDLKTKIEKQQSDLKRLEKILEKYPDIREEKDRWEHIRLCSKSANSLANDVEIRHSCGCCEDAALYAYPFIEIDGETIYCDPCRFYIGQKNYGNGEVEEYGWKNELIKHGIPQIISDKIRDNFDANKPVYEEEE